MGKFKQLYKQYDIYKAESCKDDSGFITDLLQYDIKEDYFLKVSRAVELLIRLYETKLVNTAIRNAVDNRLGHDNENNVKFCLLIDVLRCYDGLDHPTSFTTPEGIALMVLLDKLIGKNRIIAYKQLRVVDSATLSLIDLVPYVNDCSEQLGSRYSLYLPSIFKKKAPEIEKLYRRALYNLCKTIAEVDGKTKPAEEEWLNEIALLNDDDPNNDIDIKEL